MTDVKVVACLACPTGCRSCSQDESTCECYEHARLHPDDWHSDACECFECFDPAPAGVVI